MPFKANQWNFRSGIIAWILLVMLFQIAFQQNSLADNGIFDPEKKLNIAELEAAFSTFDTYDNIRTKEQREEYIIYLLRQSETAGHNLGIAKANNLLGVLLRDRSEYEKAIELHKQALMLAGIDTTIMIYSYNNLGVAYRRLDKPRIALDYHLKGLALAEQFKGDILIAQRSICVALNSIGNINLTLNQPEKALEVFQKSLSLEKNLSNDLGIAINLQNIGYAYQAMGKIDTAINYFRHSLEYNEKVNSSTGRSICLNSIGEYYLHNNQPLVALENFKKALIFAEKSNDSYYTSQNHANIGKTYMALGRFDLALPELEKYNQIAREINSGLLIKESHNLLSDYYEKKGMPQLALEHIKQAIAVNDSIVNEKNTRYLNELQTIYEAQKQQQQIELLTAENEIKNQRAFILLILIGTLILISAVIYLATRKKAEQQKNELELKLFRSQMDPHFIFNALGSIQSFMYQNEPIKAASYLGQFSSLTRSVLKNSSRELITLEEELETLKNYIEIEQMRKRNCFKYNIIIDEDIEPDFIFVPPSMIQPFVENAILHGFIKKECDKGMITIEVKNDPEQIIVTITDNGIGINASLKNKTDNNHQSMGLKIFKERIKLIEKKYKKTTKFEIVDLSEIDPDSTGTKVTICFPIIEPDDKSRNYRR